MIFDFFDADERKQRLMERYIARGGSCLGEDILVSARCCTMDRIVAECRDALCWIVAPGNSFGLMDGGLDAEIARAFPCLQQEIQAEIEARYFGELPVGMAIRREVWTPGARSGGAVVVYAPTMQVPMPIRGTANVYYAMLAVLRFLIDATLKPERIYVPLLGGGAGGLTVEESMTQMAEAIRTFTARELCQIDWDYANSMHNLWHRLTGVPYDGGAYGDE